MNLVSQYPWWMFIGCLLLGVLYAFALYYRNQKLNEFSLGFKRTLFLIRAVLASALALLLMAPLLKYQSKRVEKPIIVIAQDNSESILLTKDSLAYKTEFNQAINDLKTKLAQDYDVDHYLFDEDFQRADSTANYLGKITAFDQLFENLEERYVNRNVGAVILASDGIYNQGMNPLYLSALNQAPIYTIALGDTTAYKDARINDVRHNDIAYLGNFFPIEVELFTQELAGAEVEIRLERKGKTIWTEQKRIDEENQIIDFATQIEAKHLGVQQYDLIIKPIDEERNTLNNQFSFYIDVLDGRQKVLILAQSPHPDLAAIQAAIKNNKNYEVETALLKDWKGKIELYDLIVLHQVPARRNQAIQLMQSIEEAKISTWYIIASQSDFDVYNEQYGAIAANAVQSNTNEILPTYNSAFPLFTFSEEQLNTIKDFPPLTAPFAKYRLNEQSYSFFNQKVGSVGTENPLLAFRDNGSRKTATLVGEGLWKWRIMNYADKRNHQHFDDMISKIVQFLALKADKSLFRLNHKKQFLENEEIKFEAELYNKSYELINESNVSITLTHESGEEYNYQFSRSNKAYFLNIANLPVGNYSYEATTEVNSNKLIEKGEFSVLKLQLEAVQTVANHQLLYQLSAKSGGALFYPNTMEQLADEINQNESIVSVTYYQEKLEDIIKFKWLFFILLTLISLEWFLRKRNGAY